MSGAPTVWASRFCCDFSDEEIDAKTAIGVQPLPNLGKLRVEVAKSILDMALQKLFVPSVQARMVLRELQALSRCYNADRYPDQIAFLRNIYASDAEHASYEPRLRVTCLTGLPGVGKSAVISAFERLFGIERAEVDGHGTFELRPRWRMTVKSGSGMRQLVAHLFRHPESLGSRTIPFTATQRELCAQGVTSIHADELQFLTQGEGNALPAKLLNSLARLGPPLVYVANFSLLHRLNSRPQEEKQRLMTRPLFMYPDTPESEDWNRFLMALFGATPSFADLSPSKVGHRLWTYTFGIRRLVVALLTEAYIAMRIRDARKVTEGDIDNAYGAQAYAASRYDVEILIAGLEKSNRQRRDLWCPLPQAPNTRNFGKIINHPATEEYERRSAQAALMASMTPAERQRGGVGDPPGRRKSRSLVRPRATTESLLEGAAAMLDGTKTSP